MGMGMVVKIKKFKDIDKQIRELADRFIVQTLVKTGRYNLAVTRDGKTFYVYDTKTNTVVFSTEKLSEAVEFLESELNGQHSQ